VTDIGTVPGIPWSPGWLVRYGNLLFKTRDAVFPLVLVGLLVLAPMGTMGGDVPSSRLVDLLGVLVALTGQALRVAVIGYRYIVRGGRNREVYAEGLISSGFFATCRNPLYVGNLLILAGLFLIWNSPWMYAIGVPFFLLGYRGIVAAEEAYLGKNYGADFAAYCQRTPRWWVRLLAIPSATAGMTFNWRRVVLKEYGSAAYWMAGAALLLLLKERRYTSLGAGVSTDTPFVAAISAVALGWAVARWLKKSKRLKE
jgi:protein-S-isoprenylcysteine O-methyltransferase Ste14